MNAIEIKNLTKEYPDFKLDNLNLTLPGGCIMGLVGENGAGKSTTIKLIADMIKADSGSVTVLGMDSIKDTLKIKQETGFVLDDAGFPLVLDAEKIEKIMAKTYDNWDSKLFFSYLDKMSVPKNKMFKEFSKGMKMKLAIAVALSHDPKLLILDEATSGLDPVVRDEMLDIFNDFTRDENHSVLISSHIVSDLEKLCDYIAFLHKGKLMLCEEKDILLESYGIVHGTAAQLGELASDAVINKKITPYGAQAIVRRDAVPSGMNISPISIEELFVFMVKENV